MAKKSDALFFAVLAAAALIGLSEWGRISHEAEIQAATKEAQARQAAIMAANESAAHTYAANAHKHLAVRVEWGETLSGIVTHYTQPGAHLWPVPAGLEYPESELVSQVWLYNRLVNRHGFGYSDDPSLLQGNAILWLPCEIVRPEFLATKKPHGHTARAGGS